MFSLLSTPVGSAIIVCGVISLACWVWGRATAKKLTDGTRAPFRTLPLMVLVAMASSVLFLVFFSLAFGASEFIPTAEVGGQDPGAPTPAGIRVPPVTVAAGLFGGVLFIAFTVLKYRGHVHADEKLVLEQEAAKRQTAEHFSTRFGQAAEMLGSERAATRMGGVYALAALADEWVENRQQCVDLLCGYLRTPMQGTAPHKTQQLTATKVDLPAPAAVPLSMVPSATSSAIPDPAATETYRKGRISTGVTNRKAAPTDELAVRSAVLSSIARGTQRPLDHPASWSYMKFSLSKCYLPELQFADCNFQKGISFHGAIFGGMVNLRGTHFAENTFFDGALFMSKVTFTGATFAKSAFFRSADFRSNVYFNDVAFEGSMIFTNTRFKRNPAFLRATLGGKAGVQPSAEPIANWTAIKFDEGTRSACPDSGNSFWKRFESVQGNYKIICELPHGDRPLGTDKAHRLSTTAE